MRRGVVRFVTLPVLSLALLAAGCSTVSSDTGATTTTQPDSPTTTAATSTTSTVVTTTTEGDGAGDVPTLAEIRTARGVAVMTLNPPDGPGGPYPTLSWEPVPEAAAYWLVVSDAEGQPYWAWTGEATQVRFGGGDSDEVNQTATLHEPMTWTVIAIDSNGELVAFSEPAAIEP